MHRVNSRRLNLIIYRPGHCGHFLQYLFGLDHSVYSLCGSRTRSQLYSFKNLGQRYGSWSQHHRYHEQHFGDSRTQLTEFIKSQHSLAVIAQHPQVVNHNQTRDIHTHYYRVEVSAELDHIVRTQFFSNNQFSTARFSEDSEEIQRYQRTDTLEPMTGINLDRLIDPSTFYSQYVEISESMTVPVLARDQAEQFLDDWRQSRFLAQ